MAFSVHAPRINNNDDVVRLVSLSVATGESVSRGAVLGQVETDKAVVDLEAPDDGYVIGIMFDIDETVNVGDVVIWLGESPDEAIPQPQEHQAKQPTDGLGGGRPTAKAQMLLRRHGLSSDEVPSSGERLSAEDVEQYIASRSKKSEEVPISRGPAESVPSVPGDLIDLHGDEHGMLSTVTWSRDFASPGYIEIEYDASPWLAYAKKFAERNKLMLDPLLSLMAWQLAGLAREVKLLNATIIGNKRYEYRSVNLGFTVQVGSSLYLGVVRDADKLDESGFVDTLGELQRRAAKHHLTAEETQGATICFTSMARWKVSRHVPVLPPHTSVIVAHSISESGNSVLGASYDHRVLNGFRVVSLLRKLAKPPS